MNRSTLLFAVVAALACAPALAAQSYIVAQHERSGAAHAPAAPKARDMSCSEEQAPVADLNDYIGAHYDALQGAPLAFPAHALNKLKAASGPG